MKEAEIWSSVLGTKECRWPLDVGKHKEINTCLEFPENIALLVT